MIPQSHEIVIVKDAAAWRAWLTAHAATTKAVWVLIAKKGTTEPTTLTYNEGLEEALCHGWIDGQKTGYDEATFAQRYTPRRTTSKWSRRNVGIALRLIAEGRMLPRGQTEIDLAKATGRWNSDDSEAAI